jgi:hypothetical protein
VSNPFVARVRRVVAHPQRLSELDQFAARLAAVGATAEEIATVRETWDEFDADWTLERRTALTRLPDPELRAEVVATRQEYAHDTTSDDEQAAQDGATLWERTLTDAAGVIGKTIPEVVAWVGSDQIRAMAAVELESGEHGAGRKTLLAALRPLIEGDDL